ncbi:MAG: tetratricopeptide repeat protein [Planctomycetota bacterium]
MRSQLHLLLFAVLVGSASWPITGQQTLVAQSQGADGGVQYQINRAKRLMDQLNYQFAVKHISRAEKTYPKSGLLNLLRAECLFLLQRYDDAVTAFELGLRKEPKLRTKVPNYPYCLYKLGRLDDAQKFYAFLAKSAPASQDRAQGHFGTGLIALARGQRKQAREQMRLAYAADPHSLKINFRLGLMARLEGKLDEAIKHLEFVRKHDGLHEAALMNLAFAYAKKGNRAQAKLAKERHLAVRRSRELMGAYRGALAKNPSDLDALKGLADIYLKFGNYADALGPYKALAVARSTDGDLRYCVALCLYKTGEMRDARLQAERALRESPGHVAATKLHAKIWAEVYGPDGKPKTGDEAKPEKR